MAKQQRKPATIGQPDHGTAQLRWHRPIVLEQTMHAGLLRARNPHECLLDVMREQGALGDGRDENRRYDAGIWLRRLHQAVLGQRVTVDYDATGYGSGEMSDQQAAAHSLHARTIRAMGVDWPALRHVCCDDTPDQKGLICAALDRLADWRGI